MYPVYRVFYVDFDIERTELVAVSSSKEGADAEVQRLNNARTAKQLKAEESYESGQRVRVV